MSATVLRPASDPAERAKGIGGSDVAAILGLSPYKTALDVYLEKRGLWTDPGESEAAYWGSIMEPVLAREYVRRTMDRGSLIRYYPVLDACQWLFRHEGNVGAEEYTGPHASLLRTLTHPKYPWARGHLDAVALDETQEPARVVELKTASDRVSGYWGEEWTDQVPEFYLTQVMWYLWLADLEVADVGVLFGGNRFRVYTITRDERLIQVMIERCAEFWERVQTHDPPAPEPSERGLDSLSRLYPKGSLGKEIEATPDLVRRAEELHRLRIQAKEIGRALTAVESDLKAIMADAVRLNLGPKSYISWTNNKDSTVTNWEAAFRSLARTLAVESPALAPEVIDGTIAMHTTTKPGPRVFRVQGLEKLFG